MEERNQNYIGKDEEVAIAKQIYNLYGYPLPPKFGAFGSKRLATALDEVVGTLRYQRQSAVIHSPINFPNKWDVALLNQ